MNEAPTIPRPDPSAHRPPLRILLVDDSLTFRVATQGLLKRLGHLVDAVSDGRQALEAATCRHYDVVLMDLRMPEMDGLEATRLLRERVTGPRRPRIIAVTADPPTKDEKWYIAAGMDDILFKPLSPPQLAQALDHAAPEASVPPLALASLAGGLSGSAPALDFSATMEVVVDGLLCELRIWSEAEWASLPECERPATRVFCEGLGWIGAIPKIALN